MPCTTSVTPGTSAARRGVVALLVALENAGQRAAAAARDVDGHTPMIAAALLEEAVGPQLLLDYPATAPSPAPEAAPFSSWLISAHPARAWTAASRHKSAAPGRFTLDCVGAIFTDVMEPFQSKRGARNVPRSLARGPGPVNLTPRNR